MLSSWFEVLRLPGFMELDVPLSKASGCKWMPCLIPAIAARLRAATGFFKGGGQARARADARETSFSST